MNHLPEEGPCPCTKDLATEVQGDVIVLHSHRQENPGGGLCGCCTTLQTSDRGPLSRRVSTREQTHQPRSDEEAARALLEARAGHGSDVVALHEGLVNFHALAPSTSFGNLTPAVHETGEACPVVGAGAAPLRGKTTCTIVQERKAHALVRHGEGD